MMIIDSYCERILEKESKNKVSVLPGGVSREEFIWRLDILIKEMFAPLTEYTEADYRCGKALLLLLKKYCFSKKTLTNQQQDDDFSAYLSKTSKMLEDEIARLVPDSNGAIPVLNADKVFTLITNIMQMLTSVIAEQKKKKEKTNAQVLGINLPIMVDKQDKLRLVREDTAIVNIIPYLDEVYGISDSLDKTKKNLINSKTPYVEWVEFRYLKLVLELTKCKLDEIEVF